MSQLSGQPDSEPLKLVLLDKHLVVLIFLFWTDGRLNVPEISTGKVWRKHQEKIILEIRRRT